MKPLQKAAAAVVLSAGMLLAGGASIATAETPSPTETPAAFSDSGSLSRLITLKPTAVRVSDQLGKTASAGLPWISQASPFSQAPIPASVMLTAEDGSTWRQIAMDFCGTVSAFYIADGDVATDEPRPAGQENIPAHVGAATQDITPIADYARAFTGTARLAPHAEVFFTYGSQADPIYKTASEALEVPASPEFEADGQTWRQVIAPGMTQGFVLADQVKSMELMACSPNAAIPFTNTPALWSDLDEAQGTAPDSDSPAWSSLDVAQGTAPDTSTAVFETVEQCGMGPAGIWLIAGAGVIAAAGAAGLASSGIKGKKVRR